jgi:hypothetical protein
MLLASAFSYAQDLSVAEVDKVIRSAYQTIPNHIVQGRRGRATEADQIRILGSTEKEYLDKHRSEVNRSESWSYLSSHIFNYEAAVATEYENRSFTFNYAAEKRRRYIYSKVEELTDKRYMKSYGMTRDEYYIKMDYEERRKKYDKIQREKDTKDSLYKVAQELWLIREKEINDSIKYLNDSIKHKKAESDSVCRLVVNFIKNKIDKHYNDKNVVATANIYWRALKDPTSAVMLRDYDKNKDEINKEYFTDTVYLIIKRDIDLELSYNYRIDRNRIQQYEDSVAAQLAEQSRLEAVAKLNSDRAEAATYLPNESWLTSHPEYNALLDEVAKNRKNFSLWSRITKLNNPLNLQAKDCKYDNKSLPYGYAAFDTYEDFVGQIKYNLTGEKYKKPKVKQPKTKFSLNPVSAPPAGATIIKKK